MEEITHDMLAQFRTAYEADGQAQVLHSALAKTDMADLAYVSGGSGSAVHEKIAHDILESICQKMTGGENVKC